jgi:hypothetical protein
MLLAGAWLVPAADGELCLVHLIHPLIARIAGRVLAPAVARACAGGEEAERGQLLEVRSLTLGAYADRAELLGVVPDGVRAVSVERAGVLAPVTVPVARNAYRAIVREPTSVRFRDGHVVRSLSVTLVRAGAVAPARPG